MATRRKVFSTYRIEDQSENIELVINEQVFLFQPVISGIQLLEFVANLDSLDLEDADNILGAAGALTKIIFDTVLEQDQDRLQEYLRNPSNNVDIGVLSEMAGFLLESYTNHPIGPSSGSSDGSPTTGPGLTVVPSSNTAATSVPLPPQSLSQ